MPVGLLSLFLSVVFTQFLVCYKLPQMGNRRSLILGSGDIDTSTVVKADSDGCLGGASGASLVVNSPWKNPSGEWHVGYKVVYELCTDTLTSRLKSYDDKGPIIELCFGMENYGGSLLIHSLEDDPGCGEVADFVTVTNYRYV
ncbi:hypothetical protein PVL29_006461 [Vitis rotundifolia]|uniref:Uncharacterized protein n=1 Tax=Vitis rotundifolia TaxID=103349 RepID=A0AA39DYX1_VITRO|nr:hypothetical protein PVL29_006461 [Vitis rotundifolia]